MRLIDADVLKDNMRFRGAMLDGNYLMYVPWADVSKSIDNAPTVDAVPVVRCKDCKHWDTDNWCYYNGYIVPRDGDWFCADGERKEDEC